MTKPFRLSRRTFLAGAGTLMALPALEAMNASSALGAPAGSPLRLMVFHFPIGVNRAAWAPSGSGTNWTLGQSQQPLLAHQADLCCITGIDNSGQRSGQAGHTCNAATYLTGGDVPQSAHSMGTSADQMIAATLAGKTAIGSLQLGTSILYENPNAEPGYDPVLKDHLSWSNNTPLPKEISPQALFDRLFSGSNATSAQAARRQAYGQSVIDGVRLQASRLQAQVGKNDAAKLDQYLTGVRALEMRIQATTTSCASGVKPPPPADIREHVAQMLDLSVLAMQCDITRVITFGYEHTVTEMTHPFVGVTNGYHIGVTHNNPGAEYIAVNKWIVSQLAYLLDKMKAVTEPGGTLLDNSIVYFASELGEGSSHSGSNIPMIIAGRAGGHLQAGRLLNTSGSGNGNVLISIMQQFGVSVSSFGNGFNSPLAGLFS